MQNLLKLSLAASFLGILILLLLANSQPELINSKNQLKLGEYAKTQAKIVSIKNSNNFKIILLDNNITLTCYKCQFNINDTITAQGKVIEYKNQIEIQADKIIKNLKVSNRTTPNR